MGKKYVITGFSGFVSAHFLQFLNRNEKGAKVLGLDSHEPKNLYYDNIDVTFDKKDLMDYAGIENAIVSFDPDYILHLASKSSVASSWQYPTESFLNNTNIFLNVLEVIRKNKLKTRVLSVGSSEQYGNVLTASLPLKECEKLQPLSPYAVARVSQEMLSKIYVDSYGIDVILTRSFNHIGPGQRESFVIPSFAKQIANISKSKKREGKLIVGDIDVVRDFVDVRDVVNAYYLLLHKGKIGEVYNICTGKGFSLKDIIDLLADIEKVNLNIQVDKKLIRPADNKVIIGDFSKLKEEIGWTPYFSIRDSLTDILNSFK